jgi:hypothetical protein
VEVRRKLAVHNIVLAREEKLAREIPLEREGETNLKYGVEKFPDGSNKFGRGG